MVLDDIIASKITLLAVPVFFGAIILETIAVRVFKARGSMDTKDDLVSIFLGLMSIVTNGATAFLSIGMLFWAAQYRIATIPLSVLSVVACFVLDDLRYYVHHRMAHRIRWPWAMHVTHHSSTHFDFAVALRQGWTKHFSGTTFLKIPLVLIGFDPVLVLFCGALNAIYQFFLHTEMIDKLPKWYEAVFNTPSHHRVHHGKNPQYLDTNYAGTLIIWDKMFGTFVAEDPADKPDYGLVKDLDTLNPLTIIFHEYWGILKDVFGPKRSLKDRFLYIFAPPGWSHDGSRLTSFDIKAAANNPSARNFSSAATSSGS
ncbi:MAG: sterol desaturase/sphingolipid hydroxylase (fatty acid hydroxylase superfamily) [Hyphomonas sp.]|jgi:sterol desaturase/sphingolipid hydroxylase (fatty acid hydroxylase superfamily)